MERSKNSAKESCVAASANVAATALPVLLGGLCFTEVFMNTEWNCAPEGVFGKNTTAESPRWRVA